LGHFGAPVVIFCDASFAPSRRPRLDVDSCHLNSHLRCQVAERTDEFYKAMGRGDIVIKDILRKEWLSEPTEECRPVFHDRVCINPHDYPERAKATRRNHYLFDVLRPEIECHVAISTQAGVELAATAWFLSIE